MPKSKQRSKIRNNRLDNIQSFSIVNEGVLEKSAEIYSSYEIPTAGESLLEELEKWQIRMGLSAKSNGIRSQIGMFTDFS